jgi:uncharacterized protein (TIGR00730 family)
MMNQIKALCVYCGSRTGHPINAKLAKEMGKIMAEQGLDLVYGGGNVGLMGVIAREIKLRGGRVIGVIPDYLNEIEIAFTQADALHVVEDMYARKRMMFDLSDAFVALPGGLGTLDEILDVVTMAQLGMHQKPLVMLNHEGYWDPFLAVVDHMIEGGFVDPIARQHYATVRQIEEILPALNGWRAAAKSAG